MYNRDRSPAVLLSALLSRTIVRNQISSVVLFGFVCSFRPPKTSRKVEKKKRNRKKQQEKKNFSQLLPRHRSSGELKRILCKFILIIITQAPHHAPAMWRGKLNGTLRVGRARNGYLTPVCFQFSVSLSLYLYLSLRLCAVC